MSSRTAVWADRYAPVFVWLLAALYIVFFSCVAILRYHSFDFTDFDLSVDAQSLWAIWHGSIDSSILGMPFLGNHLNLIFFPLAPFFALAPSALTLLILQTVCLGLGAVPVFLLASKRFGRPAAVIVSLAYLLYPALHYVNYYEFHSVALAIVCLLNMLYAFDQSRFGWFVGWMVLAQLCRENVSAGVLCVGLYVRWCTPRERKWWLTPLLSGAIWGLCGFLALRYFNQGTIDFGALYRYQDFTQLFQVLWSPMNGRLLFQVFFPVACLPLLAPSSLLLGLPFFLQQLLSLRYTDHLIVYHYAALLIPCIFFAAMNGLQRLLAWRRIAPLRAWCVGGLLLTTAIANVWYGLLPQLPARFATRYTKQGLDYMKDAFIRRIPSQASVVATFEFLPQLSQRKGLYSFHHIYINTYTLSAKPYHLPDDVEYAAIDLNDSLTFTSFYQQAGYQNLQHFFSTNQWGLVDAADNLALFQKGVRSDRSLYETLPAVAPLGEARFLIADAVTMWGYQIGRDHVKSGETIPIDFVWECTRETTSDYWLALMLVDGEGKVLHQYQHPLCYRIAPTASWKQGQVFREHLWMLVPKETTSSDGWVKVVVFDHATVKPNSASAQIVPVATNIASLVENTGWMKLGRVTIEQRL